VVSAAEQLASEIRRLTRARGANHHTLAQATSYSRQYISTAENPRKGLPSAALVAALDRALAGDGRLLMLREQAAVERDARRRGATAGPVAAPAAQAPLPVAVPVVEPMRTVDGLVAGTARESAEFARAAEQTNVGRFALEQMAADVRRLAVEYPSRPVLPTFLELRDLRDHVVALLQGRQYPSQTRELYLVAGQVCGLLANASLDLGEIAAAETQARAAWLCADLAGHDGLRVWVRGTQALIAYWDNRPDEAVLLAGLGQRYRPEQGSARVRLGSIEARARARMDDAPGADAALALAAGAQETATDDEPGGMFAFPDAKRLFYAANTHLWLGGQRRAHAAERHAAQAIAHYQAAPPAQRRVGELALARLDLASALLAQRSLDGACAQITAVTAATSGRRTHSVTNRLRQLAGTLDADPWRAERRAAELRDRIHDYAATPTPLALPATTAGAT